jgi:hypothetical protein
MSVQHGTPHFENAGPGRGAALLSTQATRDFSGREFLDWDIVRFVRSQWRGRLVIKGLLHPGDVAIAREVGADGVILSNHGGRQLDGAVSPMRALPAAIQKAGDMAVMIDSGFRCGTDILKAVGLGAHCVFIGRPFNYASALAGEVAPHTIARRSRDAWSAKPEGNEPGRPLLGQLQSNPSALNTTRRGGTVFGPEALGVGGGTAARHEAGEGGPRPQAGSHSAPHMAGWGQVSVARRTVRSGADQSCPFRTFYDARSTQIAPCVST